MVSVAGPFKIEHSATAVRQRASSTRASQCHVALYLGLDGDARANSATASNRWFHETCDVDLARAGSRRHVAVGDVRFFPSLKDPAHQYGDKHRHTARLSRARAQAPSRDGKILIGAIARTSTRRSRRRSRATCWRSSRNAFRRGRLVAAHELSSLML